MEWKSNYDKGPDFGLTKGNFSVIEQEHMEPSMTNWGKEHIHLLRRTYQHPKSTRSLLTQTSEASA